MLRAKKEEKVIRFSSFDILHFLKVSPKKELIFDDNSVELMKSIYIYMYICAYF